jgi:hypothetical protein
MFGYLSLEIYHIVSNKSLDDQGSNVIAPAGTKLEITEGNDGGETKKGKCC